MLPTYRIVGRHLEAPLLPPLPPSLAPPGPLHLDLFLKGLSHKKTKVVIARVAFPPDPAKYSGEEI